MSGPHPLHPDTTAAVITALRPGVAVPCVSKVPHPRPPTFVTVQRTGGVSRTRVSDSAQLTFECWDATDEAAQDLAQHVRQLAHELADGTARAGVVIYRVDEFAGPAYLPDPESYQSRYTFTLLVHARASS